MIGRSKQKTMKELTDALERDEYEHEKAVCELNAEDYASSQIKHSHLSEEADYCPACILAAIRQRKTSHTVDFDFASSKKEWFECANEADCFR